MEVFVPPSVVVEVFFLLSVVGMTEDVGQIGYVFYHQFHQVISKSGNNDALTVGKPESIAGLTLPAISNRSQNVSVSMQQGQVRRDGRINVPGADGGVAPNSFKSPRVVFASLIKEAAYTSLPFNRG